MASSNEGGKLNILFVASVSVVAADPPESRNLYVGALGLPQAPRG